MMEEDVNSPVEINRMKQTTFVDLNKKRKLQAEQLSMPLPKHICPNRSLECNSSSDSVLRAKEVYPCLTTGEINGLTREYETDTESAKDSNSFTRYSDSIMSISGEAKIDLGSPKTCSSDQPSTSSARWDSFKNSLYSLESRSVTKSSSSKAESSNFSAEHDCPHHIFGLHPSLTYEEHLLEFGSHVECSCSEYRVDGIGHYTDKEFEDMIYSNGAPSSYVLSSGRWTVNQDADTQTGTKKLTIDKEFEQYFSMLML
ncbi:protein FAR-RED-ELONGATED HYPOCOTYL 1-LIKE-like [Forsythia ovata]|uniref:Protein FAR-RED-ELONGATED HYPOCOTYL 1-LIKE-like n=1 Tax=Forsythia ovata TaxID=205694 RepID=A0ABD1PY57_9LAMI